MPVAREQVVLCTGANRGIGLAIIQALASHPDTKSWTFLLGCRDVEKGEAAVQDLHRALCQQDATSSPSTIIPIVLDVTSDSSIADAVDLVEQRHGRLDVLINNAGYAAVPSAPDYSDWRGVYAAVYNTNVTSVALTTQLFLPLLRKAANTAEEDGGSGSGDPRGGGRVINVSSARGSLTLSSGAVLPPTVSMPYSCSKAALNLLTVEMSRDPANRAVEFQLVAPGHCRTAFNGFRGTRDPLEGATVVVQLLREPKGTYRNAGFWETRGAGLEVVEVPW